jgi:hypothetical protein
LSPRDKPYWFFLPLRLTSVSMGLDFSNDWDQIIVRFVLFVTLKSAMSHSHQIIVMHIIICLLSLFSTTKYVGEESNIMISWWPHASLTWCGPIWIDLDSKAHLLPCCLVPFFPYLVTHAYILDPIWATFSYPWHQNII